MDRNRSGTRVRNFMERRPVWALLVRVGVIASLMATAGCAGIRPATIPILFASGDAPATQLFWLHSYQIPNGMLVTGRIRAPLARLRSLSGHLDVTVRFADQRPDLVTETRWRTAPRRGRRTADFRAVIKTGAPDIITSIRVEYREGRGCSGQRLGPTAFDIEVIYQTTAFGRAYRQLE